MEHYYFIQKNGVNKGPFKLHELKLQVIFVDELIWRVSFPEARPFRS
jgi:hypothetical protein